MEDSVQPQNARKSVFQHKLWWAILTLVAISFSTYQHLAAPRDYVTDQIVLILSILGGSFSFLVIPLVLVGLFALLYRLLTKKRLRPVTFLSTYSALFGLLLLLGALGTYVDVDQQRRAVEREADSTSEPYLFQPEGSEYSVAFADTPKISHPKYEAENIFAVTAELALAQDGSFQRAESAKFLGDQQPAFTRQQAESAIHQYAEYNGLEYPEYRYDESEMGKVVSVRGFKSLKDAGGQEVKTTYKVVMYYGDSSVMSLYVGAPSKTYPTPEIMSFLNSIRRN